jgi:hypothetical protein
MMRQRGNALIETIVVLLALSPFAAGMALLGKQLDVKHKTYDALRYSVWERTVWSEGGRNAKSPDDITLEALDRSFGHPHAGVSATESLRVEGVSQNPLWRDGTRSLLADSHSAAFSGSHTNDTLPVRAGYVLVPALAHGAGPVSSVIEALQLRDLELNARGFASARLIANVRPVLAERASRAQPNPGSQPITHIAHGAILSDMWTSRDEAEFRRKTDNLTADELVETLELPGRPIAMQALSKGGPLYGEGQYSWDPDLRPRSNVLPSAYVTDREGD